MFLFFFNDTATTEIYTLSLHDALPILDVQHRQAAPPLLFGHPVVGGVGGDAEHVGAPEREGAGGFGKDRKSTRLNSSHANISYAVFCLKKKNYSDTHSTHHTICVVMSA